MMTNALIPGRRLSRRYFHWVLIGLPLVLGACHPAPAPAPPQVDAPPATAAAPSGSPAFTADFEDGGQLPPGWTSEGTVSIDGSSPAFKGTHSLCLSRTQADAEKACSATSPTFKVQPGLWNIEGGSRPDLYSPDSSFDGTVALECLDQAGGVAATLTINDTFGKNGWNGFGGQYEIPASAVAARFRIQLNKTYGQFWVDGLAATYLGPAPHRHIDRLVFSTVALGNLLYPTDSRVVTLTVQAMDELAPDEQQVDFVVRDYWGAEQTPHLKVPLKAAGKQGEKFVYEGSVDLAGQPLEEGRYYEMHGVIPAKDKPFHNYSGIAIVPEAANNSFPPEDVPFTSRNWDGRMPEGFELAHRMGFRIMNIWSGWDATPPYTPHAPCVELCQKYGMGALFGTPAGLIETHGTDWQKYDEKALRDGVRNLLTTYGKLVHPCILELGNEPPGLAERVPDDVKAYKAIYEEAKKVDPAVKVLATSTGDPELFFKAGFGAYCDYYDFHIYEDPQNVGLTLQKYHELFKKYGHPHPIWSTELGLNSEGLARHPVAIDMAKKFAIFFANGGANMSWFDLFYPDPDAKIADSNGASFDVFDSRYVKYNPKLTALTYYDLLNSISIKKFIAQQQYGADTHGFLFRDRHRHDLQILWKDGGRQDAFVPLPGARKVELVRLDGTHRSLDAQGSGVTLTVDTDPILLLYDGSAPLAAKLDEPRASIASMPAAIVRGGSADVVVSPRTGFDVAVVPPPFWEVRSSGVSASANETFTLTAPGSTEAREADVAVDIKDAKGTPVGELYFRPRVNAQVAADLQPVPPTASAGPSVRLTLKNNGTAPRDVNWTVSLVDEMPLTAGDYESHVPTQARLDAPATGQVSLAPGDSHAIDLPLAGTDPLTVYHLRSQIDDSTGTSAVHDRNVGGFVAVPKATGPIDFDGALEEADWKNAPVEKYDQERQYFSYDKANVKWKGVADLSGTLRFLWDDKYLYVGVEVTDDIAGGKKADDMLWAQDGLQFLIDPCRGLAEKVGKYDYAIADGTKGLEAWCSLTADAGAPNGRADDIKLSAKRKGDGTGAITYEIAFPWSRLAPFKPASGADLGLSLILNEDDGAGRKSFMAWFGNAHSKEVEPVGDLILQP